MERNNMIVMNEEFPKNCLTCPVREKIGCKIANESGWLDNIRDERCPFEPAEPVDISAVAEAIEENSSGFEVAELICLRCLKRFIDVRPLGTLLKNLECPGCHKTGYIIETGEYMTENN